MSDRINLQQVRTAVNTVLDHLVNDLKLSTIEIDPQKTFIGMSRSTN